MAEIPPMNSGREIFVTYIESAGKFFVIDGDKMATLDAIRLELEKQPVKFSSSNADISDRLMTPDDWKPFSPCIAFWQGRWYRARIISRRTDGKFEVEYVDYGNTDAVEFGAIKKRPQVDLISRTEALAWPCRLNGDINRMDKTRFEEISSNIHGRFCMRVDDVDRETGQHVVTLFYKDGSRYVCLNHAIIGISPPKQPVPQKIRTQKDRPYRFIGPMGKSNLRELFSKGRNVAEVNNTAHTANEYPLVDLSEPVVNMERREPRRNPAAMRPTSTFLSDMDAVLNGPIEDFESDEEEEESTRHDWSASSNSIDSSNFENDSLRALKETWAPLLSLRYGNPKTPPPGSLTAEQQVTITRIVSPTDFYAQTVQQRDGLKRLELSMGDQFNPNQPPIPSILLEPGVCCAVYSDVSKTWRRAQVIRINRENQSQPMTADIYLVDTGFERNFPVSGLKPINEHFTVYLPLVFHVKLAHQYFESIHWRFEDTETFRRLVENRPMIMKFVMHTPVPEVEVVDMMHSCVVCSSRIKKCTINDLMFQWIQRNGGLSIRA